MKHYSSGMYVRLGFAVAVNVDPDVLLVDEVLAVGDEVFQTKCLEPDQAVPARGHAPSCSSPTRADTVRQICDRAIVLDHGQVVLDGTPGDAIRILREHLHGTLDERTPLSDDGTGLIGTATVHHEHEHERTPSPPRRAVRASSSSCARRSRSSTRCSTIEITDRRGNLLYGADTDGLGTPLSRLDEPRPVRVRIGRTWLLDGDYPVSLKLTDRASGRVLDWREGVTSFQIASAERAEGLILLDVAVDEQATAAAPGDGWTARGR